MVLHSEADLFQASSQRYTLLSRALQSRLVSTDKRRAVQHTFSTWKSLTAIEIGREAAVRHRFASTKLVILVSAFSRWRHWAWSRGEHGKLFKRAVGKLAVQRMCAAFRSWNRCVELSKYVIVADAWSRQQIVVSAFVVWRDRVREKRLASIVKDAEGEREALTEAEARAQSLLSEREFRIGLLESQLAVREQLLHQRQTDLESARSRVQLLESQLGDTIQELRTVNAERKAVQRAVSERGQQVQQLADAVRETNRLKAENELLATGLEIHATKEQELALKVDEIEKAILDEQVTHARLQLQYEAQLRDETRARGMALQSHPTVATAQVASPEEATEQFSSPGSAHGSGNTNRVAVAFHHLPQRTAMHVGTPSPSIETQRLTLSPVRKSPGRSERSELYI